MTRPAKTLREAAHDLTLMSDDGSEYEHNDGCQGEPDCPACWVEGIRQLFVDFSTDPAPIDLNSPVLQDRLAQACGDPGSIVGRQHHTNEPLPRWQMRAVLHVLAEVRS